MASRGSSRSVRRWWEELLVMTARLTWNGPARPRHGKTPYRDIESASRRARIHWVPACDARRTFRRIPPYAGASPLDSTRLHNDETVDMTAHYIGVDEARIAATISEFETSNAEALTAGA